MYRKEAMRKICTQRKTKLICPITGNSLFFPPDLNYIIYTKRKLCGVRLTATFIIALAIAKTIYLELYMLKTNLDMKSLSHVIVCLDFKMF